MLHIFQWDNTANRVPVRMTMACGSRLGYHTTDLVFARRVREPHWRCDDDDEEEQAKTSSEGGGKSETEPDPLMSGL